MNDQEKDRPRNGQDGNYVSNRSYTSNVKTGKLREEPLQFFKKTELKKEWIQSGADEDMVKYAENAGKYMAPQGVDKRERDRDRQCLSTSQIRNVFGELKRIQGNFDDHRSSFYLLKPKLAYAEGRKKTDGLALFKMIFDSGWEMVKGNKKYYLNFCNLIEAIIAYHKAYGGND